MPRLVLIVVLLLLAPSARATPYCEAPEDPLVFPNAATVATSCGVHILTELDVDSLAPGDITLRVDGEELPAAATEGQPISHEYPTGYDCTCQLEYRSATIRRVVIAPESPFAAGVTVEVVDRTGDTAQILTSFKTTDESGASCGKEPAPPEVLCSTCDPCGYEDAGAPVGSTADSGGVDPQGDAGVEPTSADSGVGANPGGPPTESGCSVVGLGHSLGTLPLLLLLLYGCFAPYQRAKHVASGSSCKRNRRST